MNKRLIGFIACYVFIVVFALFTLIEPLYSLLPASNAVVAALTTGEAKYFVISVVLLSFIAIATFIVGNIKKEPTYSIKVVKQTPETVYQKTILRKNSGKVNAIVIEESLRKE